MKLDTMQVQNCRNIEKAVLQCDPELTIIAGPNGQGKTNLLECIWLLTGSKSFRGSKDIELIRDNQDFARIIGNTVSSQSENQIELLVAAPQTGRRGRRAKVNGVEYGRATSIAGVFTAVVFEPGHLSLIKGGPDGRRRFIDAALCQLYPGYITTLRRYMRALTQKNSVLKKYYQTAQASSLLDAFDAELSQTGEEITKRRAAYLQQAALQAQLFYDELSQSAEKLSIQFLPCCDAGNQASKLQVSRAQDIHAGFSTFGPHREDFDTEISGKNARSFASQGQKRSVVLSLKLAEAAVAQEITGEHPVMLLDDVLSELDEKRQAYLLKRIAGKQCFVTTCDVAAFARTAGKIVKIWQGEIVQV